jgi:hypothetical protein
MLLLWIFILLVVIAIKNDMFGIGKISKGNANVPQVLNVATPLHTQNETAPIAQATPSTLVIEGGVMNGTRIPLGESDIVFGRSKNATVVLNDSYVSLMHMRVFKQNGKWYAEDLDSTNGTYIDGDPLIGITEFGIGQRISIGETVIRLKA